MKRIQRKRTKNWKLPQNAVYIGRPTRFGNPLKVETDYRHSPETGEVIAAPRREALSFYRVYLKEKLKSEPDFLDDLRGKNLACWCRLSELCHADVILEKFYPLTFTASDLNDLRQLNWLAKDDRKKSEFCYRLKDILLTVYSSFNGYDLQKFTKPLIDYDYDEPWDTGEIYSWHEHILERRKIGDAIFHRPTNEFRYGDICDHKKQSERFNRFLKLCNTDHKITETLKVPEDFDKPEAVRALRRLVHKFKYIFRGELPKPERAKYPFLQIRSWSDGGFDEFKVRVPKLVCSGCGSKLITNISFWDLLKIKKGIFEQVRSIRCDANWNYYGDCPQRIKEMRSNSQYLLREEKGWQSERRLVSIWAKHFFSEHLDEFEKELNLTERFEKHWDEFSKNRTIEF